MTNCCDEYGECRQSDDCPIRTGVVLPHQAACAARVKAKQQEEAARQDEGEPLSNAELKEMGILFVVAVLVVAGLAWAATNLVDGVVFMWKLLS